MSDSPRDSDAETFPNLRLVAHPLVQHKLTILRDKTTPPIAFRQLLRELGLLLGYEITRDLPLERRPIETPMAQMNAPHLASEITIVSILRAGLGLAEGIRELMPMAREGHIGVFRDPESKKPQEYYVKLPEAPGRALLIDPMLATGGSAAHAIDVLIARGVPAAEIRFLCLVAAPEGVSRLAEAHPEVTVVAGALDSHLDSHAYIVPGLGDAGDRLFGTL
ncbi:uracil phosphoribosyltransferase [Algihabitans sp.]|uniref:uracil phosphoribosyltransferase n=1 Tax=Algihabitans sp. TaxID=2821514 RepID=UPI003BA87CCC